MKILSYLIWFPALFFVFTYPWVLWHDPNAELIWRLIFWAFNTFYIGCFVDIAIRCREIEKTENRTRRNND